MQVAIYQAGYFRMIAALIGGTATRLFGRHGDFYRIAGNRISEIDGFNPDAMAPFDKFAMIGPGDPDGYAQQIEDTFRIPTVIIDGNNINVEVLGASRDCRSTAPGTPHPAGQPDGPGRRDDADHALPQAPLIRPCTQNATSASHRSCPALSGGAPGQPPQTAEQHLHEVRDDGEAPPGCRLGGGAPSRRGNDRRRLGDAQAAGVMPTAVSNRPMAYAAKSIPSGSATPHVAHDPGRTGRSRGRRSRPSRGSSAANRCGPCR